MAKLNPDGTGDYRFLFALVRPFAGALLLTLALMCVQSALTLTMPWLAGRFSAAMLQGEPVAMWLKVWFVLILMLAAIGYVVGVRMQQVTSQLIADACTRLFDHLQALPLGWHHDRRRGDVLSLLTADTYRLGYFVTSAMTPVLPMLLVCLGALVMMLAIEPRIGLAVAVLVPAIYLALKLAGRRLRPLAIESNLAYAMKSAIAEQSLAMMPMIKAYVGEQAESARFAAQTRRLRDLEMREARLQGAIAPLVRVVAAGCVMLLLWLASRGVASGAMTAAELVTLLLYGLLLTQPVSQLASVYGQVQSARGTAKRLIAAFAAAPEPDDGPGTLHRVRGEITFDAVRFAYPGREVMLEKLDLRVHAGETVAITGANGAGKSTLIHLLMRFSDPGSGAICIDGTDIRDVTLKSLRAQIALVSQNVLLFNASIADNIGYGQPGATQDQIEAAARAARAHDFIAGLPQGYATEVGDQGIRLSGGQKQRVALARALLKDSAILVLDEATAMFDPDGELSFIAHCRELMAGRTVLLITHRPASLALADRILRLENGRFVAVDPSPRAGRDGVVAG